MQGFGKGVRYTIQAGITGAQLSALLLLQLLLPWSQPVPGRAPGAPLASCAAAGCRCCLEGATRCCCTPESHAVTAPPTSLIERALAQYSRAEQCRGESEPTEAVPVIKVTGVLPPNLCLILPRLPAWAPTGPSVLPVQPSFPPPVPPPRLFPSV